MKNKKSQKLFDKILTGKERLIFIHNAENISFRELIKLKVQCNPNI